MNKRITAIVFVFILCFSIIGPVERVNAGAIKLSKTNISIIEKHTKQLILKKYNKKITKGISWKSSKKSVAVVSKKGVVTAKKAGKSVITAVYKKKKYKCKVTVKKSKDNEQQKTDEKTSEEKTSEQQTTDNKTSEEKTSEQQTTDNRTSEQKTSEEKTTEEKTTEENIDPGEKMKIAYDLGLVTKDMYEHSNANATRRQTALILQEVYKYGYNKESRYLRDMYENVFSEEDMNKTATRYFFAQALFFAECENYFDFEYDNYNVWANNCLYNASLDIDQGPDAALVLINTDGTAGESGLWSSCTDLVDIENGDGNKESSPFIDYGATPAVDYCLKLYDRTDGKKVFELDKENRFRPFEDMTIREVAETALRYYSYFEDSPEMVSYENTKSYDKSIITDELLEKDSNLPDCSCSNLPANWHGVLIADMAWVTGQACGNTPDKKFYDYEIQAFKDAGFNFVGLMFNFSTLQGPIPEAGKLNETRLKELDRVIADCIARDIHVELRCVGVGGSTAATLHSDDLERSTAILSDMSYSTEFANLWGALAKRYKNIPNKYLDFNLLVEAGVSSEDHYVEWFTPSVEAIRAENKDRCIVADVHAGNICGEGMAKMGVALSAHVYEPRELYYDPKKESEEDYLNKLTWPYTATDGVTYDADAAFHKIFNGTYSNEDIAETAKKYNVGFMVGEWGSLSTTNIRKRASDEVICNNLIDMTSYMKKKGYGWCYADAYFQYGPCAIIPWITDAEYEQIGDHYLYRDVYISNLFKEINGVQ